MEDFKNNPNIQIADINEDVLQFLCLLIEIDQEQKFTDLID